jgi:putative ABC transport system permease protein
MIPQQKLGQDLKLMLGRKNKPRRRLNLAETTRLAWYSILSNRLRSALTMLGVIIGIAAVIAMVTIGEGAHAQTESQLKALGSNLIYIRSGVATTGSPASLGAGSATTLTWEDAKAIAKSCSAVRAVAPSLNTQTQVVRAELNTQTYIAGTTPEFVEVRDFLPLTGRFFNQIELDKAARVAVLGQSVVANLGLTSETALGETIRIQGEEFTVIGTLEYRGSSPFRDQDDQVVIPLTTMASRIIGINSIYGISLENVLALAKSPEHMEAAQYQITNLLRLRHKIAPPRSDDFMVRNQADLVSASNAVSRIFTILLGGSASISLVVGGIGIMNIMFVSVSERTREIGIRRAVGARSSDILRQFLIESTVLSVIGGMLGIALGIGASVLINLALGWKIGIPFNAIFLSLGVCLVIGIFFGAYPAHKASRLDPITALRSE